MSTQEPAGTVTVAQKAAVVRWLPVCLLSALLLIPCFWQRHVQAGDLASHMYNAWLAGQVQQGKAPGLQIVGQSNNFLFDVAAQHLGAAVGYTVAEKALAALWVLLFFWGAFALASVVAGGAAWGAAPLLLMIAYGWVFQMGFMNFYAALAFAFWGLAAWWAGGRWRFSLPVLLALAWMAHPMGAALLVGAILVIELLTRIEPRWHLALLPGLCAAILAVRQWIAQHYVVVPSDETFYELTGANQFLLFSKTYGYIAYPALALLLAFIGLNWVLAKNAVEDFPTSRALVAAELALLALVTCWALPNGFVTPRFAYAVNFITTRLSVTILVLAACLWSATRIRRWQLVAFALIAAGYFAMLYRDTARLDRMEDQARALVQQVPAGSRVVPLLDWPGSKVIVHHIVDRACIGRCYSYANYEPPSGQFRLRAVQPNPFVVDHPQASDAVQQGKFIARPQDVPLYEIYQCGAADRLCMHPLEVGESSAQIIYERGWLAHPTP